MHTMKMGYGVFRQAVAGAALMLASAAQALPVTVSAGSPQAFNFDLTGQTPAPPYPTMNIRVEGDGFATGDVYLLQVFSALDLGGTLVYTAGPIVGNDCCSGNLVFEYGLSQVNWPGLEDGLFSVRLSAPTGSYQIDVLAATGTDANDQQTSRVTGVPVTGSVPEPGTASLGVLALIALAAGAWRRRRVRPTAAT